MKTLDEVISEFLEYSQKKSLKDMDNVLKQSLENSRRSRRRYSGKNSLKIF